MRLELNQAQREALVMHLQSGLSGLQDKIAHTDSRDYRDGLKTRKALLAEVLEELQQAEA